MQPCSVNSSHRTDGGGQLSGSQLTGWGTTATNRVPGLQIGERPREVAQRVAPDKEGATDKQCLGDSDFKPGQMVLA